MPLDSKHKHAAASLLATAGILIGIILIVRAAAPSDASPTAWPNAWYYDLNTKKLFVARQTNLPPVEGPTGQTPEHTPAGVWAYVYSCTSCDNPQNHFVAWIEKLTPKSKSELHALIAPMEDGHGEFNPFETLNLWDQEGRLVATPEHPAYWLPSNSDEAESLRSESLARCGDGVEPKACPPLGEEFTPPPQQIAPPGTE